MLKVLFYSLLLVLGLAGSQVLPEGARGVVSLATMFALAFIMIHVGYEFELDRSRLGKYVWDYFVAAAAAMLPWAFCAIYFVIVMSPRSGWGAAQVWKGALLQGLFAAPTSAGVLFSMLAAAGLGASWLFAKARVLAIFDDLHTILLLIPLKMMLIGPRWQLFAVAMVMLALLWAAWRFLHRVSLPVAWPFVMGYAGLIVVGCELVLVVSRQIDPAMPIHLEVLLPAFALGCVLARPMGADPHVDDARAGHEEGPETPTEQHVSTVVSACFMVLVGLSMPGIFFGSSAGAAGRHWTIVAVHVMVITILSNIGKLFPAMCYRNVASLRERLALAVGMFPRGEVGAGVLVVSLSYGFGGDTLTVAVLSLALNLLCTGVFIIVVKKLLNETAISANSADRAGAISD